MWISFRRTRFAYLVGREMRQLSRTLDESDCTTSFEVDCDRPTPLPLLAHLFARMLLQAVKDQADRMAIDLEDGRLTYRIDGTDYDMVPLGPAMMVDLYRLLVRSLSLTSTDAGSLQIPIGPHRPALDVWFCFSKLRISGIDRIKKL